MPPVPLAMFIGPDIRGEGDDKPPYMLCKG